MRGERIELLREKANLSRTDIAKALSTTRTTVYRWEKNVNEPSDDIKRKLATLLNTSVAYLMGEMSPSSPPTEADKTGIKLIKRGEMLKSMREETELTLSEASLLLDIPIDELKHLENEVTIDKKKTRHILAKYGVYLDNKEKTPEINEVDDEIKKVVESAAKDGLIRKSTIMMEGMTEEEKYKVFQYIQDQEYIARMKKKKEA